MKNSLAIACLFAVLPAPLWAQGKKAVRPEALLAADVVAFLRYDGYDAHRSAYEKTTLAQVMKDDLGEFIEYLMGYARDHAFGLKRRFDDKGKELFPEKTVVESNKFMEHFWKHGVVVGVELTSQAHADFDFPGHWHAVDRGFDGLQLTVILPEAGRAKNYDAISPFLHLAAGAGGFEIAEKKEDGRVFFGSTDPGNKLVWWREGDHVVIRLGPEPVRQALDVIEGRKPNLTSAPLFAKLTKFDSYETDIRGLVNVRKILDLARNPGERESHTERILEALARHVILHHVGAVGLDGLTFHMGFEGKFQRSTVILDVPPRDQRTGLLKVLSAPVAVSLDKLPAMPPDTAAMSVSQVDWEALYELVMQTGRLMALGEAIAGGGWPRPENLFNPNEFLGIDVKKDLLDTFDSTVVTYNAHSEGPFFMGQTVALKVKDAKKLQKTIDVLTKALINQFAPAKDQVTWRSRTYRGAQIFTLSGPREMPLPVAYTIHKDWLVVSLMPQAVKGHVMRTEGKHKTWQAPPYLPEILARAKKQNNGKSILTGVSVIDPRPTFEIGLALLPTLATVANLAADASFDVTKIPNAQAVNEHLYPTVSLFYDDDTALRWDNHFAADLPIESVFILPYFSLLGGF